MLGIEWIATLGMALYIDMSVSKSTLQFWTQSICSCFFQANMPAPQCTVQYVVKQGAESDRKTRNMAVLSAEMQLLDRMML